MAMTTTETDHLPVADPDMTAGRLRQIVEELTASFLERQEVVRTLLLAVLAGQHALVLGPPGTAKSQLARELTSRFTGARYWEVLLSKFTDPKRIFGPVDVGALTRDGEYRQLFEGRATQCEIAFVDEIFKCSSASLNEMLAWLNERLYHPEAGGSPLECPLVSAITASNELPADDELAAIYDRLLVRIEVGYLVDPTNFAALVRSAVQTPTKSEPTTVDLADLLHAVRVTVPAVQVPDGVINAICDLRRALRRAELITSDRRWKQAIRLLQASAYLDGRAEVTDTDLEVLTHVLWDSPAQRPTVEREVLSLINPDARAALDLGDAIAQIERELDAKAGESHEKLSEWGTKEANKKLSTARRKLEAMQKKALADGRSTQSVDRVLAQLRAVTARVLIEALRIDPAVVRQTLDQD
ncbi:AAA family ATPase [Kutzneria buriramensis]